LGKDRKIDPVNSKALRCF